MRDAKIKILGLYVLTGAFIFLGATDLKIGWYPETGEVPIESDIWGNGDAYSRPEADYWPIFETLAYCSPSDGISDGLSYTIYTSEQRYNKNDLFLFEDPDAKRFVTRWTINPKTTSRAVFQIHRSIPRCPQAVAFRIKNNSQQELTFYPELYEMPTVRNWPAVSWLLGQKTLKPGEEKELVFNYDEFKSRQGKQIGRPDHPAFPVTPVLRVNGLQAGADNELIMKEFTVYYASPEAMNVTGLTVSDRVVASQPVTINLTLRGKIPENGFVDLETENRARVMWRIRLSDEEKQQLSQDGKIQLTKTIPWYLNAGDYQLYVVHDGYRIAGAECKFKLENSRQPGYADVKREIYNGRPTLTVNGKPETWWGYAGYMFYPGVATGTAKSGGNAYCIATTVGAHLMQVVDPTWIAPDKYDYSQINEYVNMVLAGNTNAWLIMRVNINLPYFWYQEHKEDQALMQTDSGLLPWQENGCPTISIASEPWQKDSQQALIKLMEYVEQQPWADRVIGFWTSGAVTEEWFAYGCNDGYYGDYSPVNQREFKKWLEANNFPVKEGDNMPERDARRIGGKLLFEDNAQSALYHQYAAEKTADVVEMIVKTVKDQSKGKVLAGIHYGYLIQFAGTERQVTSATLPVTGRLFRNENVDFCAGVALLDWRRLNGYDTYVTPVDSVLSHGKLYMVSDDTFSYMHPRHWHFIYESKNPHRGLVNMHRRVVANAAVHGIKGMLFGLQPTWHGGEAFHKEYSKEIEVYQKTYDLNRESTEEIAFIIDDVSMAWVPAGSAHLRADIKSSLYNLGKSGAPVSLWLLSDIDRLPEQTKLIVISFADAPNKEDLAKLKNVIQKGGRTVVVIGYPGLIDVEKAKWDEKTPAEVLGLPLLIDDGVYDAERPEPWQRMTFKPWTSLERPLANNGHLIWMDAPPMTPSIWRQFVERSGAHCYAPQGFFVHSAKELVSITSPENTTAEIVWPETVKVEDMFEEWKGEGQIMKIPFEYGQTRLFKVEKK